MTNVEELARAIAVDLLAKLNASLLAVSPSVAAALTHHIVDIVKDVRRGALEDAVRAFEVKHTCTICGGGMLPAVSLWRCSKTPKCDGDAVGAGIGEEIRWMFDESGTYQQATREAASADEALAGAHMASAARVMGEASAVADQAIEAAEGLSAAMSESEVGGHE